MTLYLNFLNSFIEFILFSFFSLPLDIGHYRRQRRQVVRSPDWCFHQTGLVKMISIKGGKDIERSWTYQLNPDDGHLTGFGQFLCEVTV